VPNIAGVSVLSILNSPFGFLYLVFAKGKQCKTMAEQIQKDKQWFRKHYTEKMDPTRASLENVSVQLVADGRHHDLGSCYEISVSQMATDVCCLT
jgi:hypothetical protein